MATMNMMSIDGIELYRCKSEKHNNEKQILG